MKKKFGILKYWLSVVALTGFCLFSQPAKAAGDTSVSDFAQLKAALANSAIKTIDVTADIDITEELQIVGEKELFATNNVSLKLTATDVDNMFVVTAGSKFSVTGMTLDGNGEGRLIDSFHQAVIQIKDSTLKNGSTDSFEKRIDPDSGANLQRYSGGAIHMHETTLHLENTVFENNRTKAVTPKRENPGDELPVGHGGAIMAKRSSVITVKGGEFRNNQTGISENEHDSSGEGGAIKLEFSSLKINDANTPNAWVTKFSGNHLGATGSIAGRQGGAIEATGSTVDIYKGEFEIVGPFNTGGAIKFESSTGMISHTNFTITSTQGMDFGIAGGAITSENSNLTIQYGVMKTSPQARVREAGGLIQVVGSGTFNMKQVQMTGSGAWFNAGRYTANTGGAISFYSGSTVTAVLEDVNINNFMVDGTGAGIAIARNHNESAAVNLSLKNVVIRNAAAYTYDNNGSGGCLYIGKGDSRVTIEGGGLYGSTASNNGGGIYNLGHLTITGGASIRNNKAYQMAAGIYNGGYLLIDEANVSSNEKGDWSIGNGHQLPNINGLKELSGENIYADQDVIITPKAVFDHRDVRVLDGQSAVVLTGALEAPIPISISEAPKTTTATSGNVTTFTEDAKRKVGYVVAKGDGNYTPTAEDARFLHYVSKDASQAISAVNDHTGVGAWDYVLDPTQGKVVLGQRTKLVYHANGTADKPAKFITDNDHKEQLYTIYSSTDPWMIPAQMTKITEEPTRDGFDFAGWYLSVNSTNDAAAATANNDHQIQNLVKADDVSEYLFDFTEKKFAGNTLEITSILNPYIINTYAGWTQTVTIPVEKRWVDTEDAEKVPVNIHLLANGERVDTLTLDAAKAWKGEFAARPVYRRAADGTYEAIQYTLEEEALTDFRTDVSPQTISATAQLTAQNAGGAGATFIVTNTKINHFDLTVTKQWEDSDNAEGLRPTSISVTLTPSSGAAQHATLTADANGEWKHVFTNLLKKDDQGDVITYTLSEAPVTHYRQPVITAIEFEAGSVEKATATITNQREVEYIDIVGKKVWDDGENQDGLRPTEIVVSLKDGSEEVLSKRVEGSGNEWAYRFDGVQKYRKGREATYTVSEENVPVAYTSSVSGTTIKNTHSPELTDIEVEKIWDDADNQDGKRPETITVELIADGQPTNQQLEIRDDGNGVWKNSFRGLPVFKNGNRITYGIKELDLGIDGYTSTINSFTVTNHYVPEKIVIAGEKIWNDNQDQDGKRPEKIQLSLMKGETVVESLEVTADSLWQYSFRAVPKFENGQQIAYRVKEEPVAHYQSEYNGYNVINTHEPEKLNLKLTKIWDDGENIDQLRPATIAVQLYANDVEKQTVVLSAESGWTETIEGLDRYQNGTEINYTLKEEPVQGYTATVSGDVTTGFVITNQHSPYPRYKQTHRFISGTDGRELPQELVDRTPADVMMLLDGSEVVPEPFDHSPYRDEADNGFWTFKAWNHTKQVVAAADVEFIGIWIFTADAPPVNPPVNHPINPPVDPSDQEEGENPPGPGKEQEPSDRQRPHRVVPGTGDRTDMKVLLIVLSVSAVLLVAAIVIIRKKQNK